MVKVTLTAARVNAAYSQEQLAEKLGVARTTVANWESGKTEMKVVHLCAFCELTGFKMDEILLPTKYA